MWQNSQGRDAARRQHQGSISRANGLHFEEIIDAGCNYYRVKGAADIEKTPEPMRAIKDMGGGKFLAVYTKAAQADYKGLLAGGRAINFEAKHTDTGRMEQSRVTEDQAERLQRCAALGGIAFVLCSFGPMDFFRVPWNVWQNMKGRFGHKYITPQEVETFRVRFGGPGVLLFLEGIGGKHGLPDAEN